MSQAHAAGRGLLAGTGSYAQSAVAVTSQSAGYATGRGGAMEYAGLELPAARAARPESAARRHAGDGRGAVSRTNPANP